MNDKDTTTSKGKRAEDLAAKFLEQNGLKVLARNYLCRGGEIDLVCRDKERLVFVEVRMRGSSQYGGAGASITITKQKKIIHAAEQYLHSHRLSHKDCRFDCVLFDKMDLAHVEWVQNAFSAD